MNSPQKELTALGWKDVSAAHLIGLTTRVEQSSPLTPALK